MCKNITKADCEWVGFTADFAACQFSCDPVFVGKSGAGKIGNAIWNMLGIGIYYSKSPFLSRIAKKSSLLKGQFDKSINSFLSKWHCTDICLIR